MRMGARWLRLCWVCLLALALPLQGMAAATLLHCAKLAPPAAQPHAHAQAHAATAHAHHEHHKHHAPQGGPALADEAAPANPDGPAAASTKCSACAACCAAAALPVAWASLPLLKPASAAIAFQTQAWVAPVASGPERPPRNHLA